MLYSGGGEMTAADEAEGVRDLEGGQETRDIVGVEWNETQPVCFWDKYAWFLGWFIDLFIYLLLIYLFIWGVAHEAEGEWGIWKEAKRPGI